MGMSRWYWWRGPVDEIEERKARRTLHAGKQAMGKTKLGRQDVAQILEDFLTGRGDTWAWDDYMSFALEDEELDRTRIRCSGVDTEFPPVEKRHFCGEKGFEVIRGLIRELRAR